MLDQIADLKCQTGLLRIAEEQCSWSKGEDVSRNLSRIALLLGCFLNAADCIIDSLQGEVRHLSEVLDHQTEDNTP